MRGVRSPFLEPASPDSLSRSFSMTFGLVCVPLLCPSLAVQLREKVIASPAPGQGRAGRVFTVRVADRGPQAQMLHLSDPCSQHPAQPTCASSADPGEVTFETSFPLIPPGALGADRPTSARRDGAQFKQGLLLASASPEGCFSRSTVALGRFPARRVVPEAACAVGASDLWVKEFGGPVPPSRALQRCLLSCPPRVPHSRSQRSPVLWPEASRV